MGNYIFKPKNIISEKSKTKKRKISEIYNSCENNELRFLNSSSKLTSSNDDFRIKRYVIQDDDDENEDNKELYKDKYPRKYDNNIYLLMKPNKKRMKSTSSYIFKTLFIDGENSDIKVRALNHEWKLHKIYLCQSPYFDSMFKGYKWKESNQSCIEIAVPDQNINLKSLDITFGSFYSEEIDIVPLESINILACASLFNLNGLINQCALIMIENLNSESVLAFYDASLTYGLKSVSEIAFKWLCINIMNNDNIQLCDINFNLFEKIITSPEFLIVQVETDLYSLCKKWLYYQLNRNEIDKQTKSQKIINDFFKSLLNGCKNESKCILEDDSYSLYQNIFKKIRFQHIITDYSSLKLIYSDRIIPHSWLDGYYFRNWMSLIYIDQDKFSHEFEIDLNEFEKECLRFGRVLDEKESTWRWVGFNYGLDLVVSHTNRTLKIRRNTLHGQSPYKGLSSNKNIQRIYFSIKLVQVDNFGNEVWNKQTQVKCLDLNRNEEKVVEDINPAAKYPLILNLKIITYPLNLTNLLFEN